MDRDNEVRGTYTGPDRSKPKQYRRDDALQDLELLQAGRRVQEGIPGCYLSLRLQGWKIHGTYHRIQNDKGEGERGAG